MINFPDFEEQYEIFENLTSMHVSINLGSVSKARQRSMLLMSGLQLPMFDKKAAAAAAAAADDQQDGNVLSEEDEAGWTEMGSSSEDE
jgi:phage portal protein BeeE